MHGFLWLKNGPAIDEMDLDNQDIEPISQSTFRNEYSLTARFLIIDQQLIHAGDQDPQVSADGVHTTP